MILGEKLREEVITEHPVTEVYFTKEWKVFQWNDCLYYVSTKGEVPTWDVDDKLSALDIMLDWRGREKDEFKFKDETQFTDVDIKILEHTEIYDRAYQRGRVDMLLEIQKNYGVGGMK